MLPTPFGGLLRRLGVDEVEKLLARKNPALSDQRATQLAAAGILSDGVRRRMQFSRRLLE